MLRVDQMSISLPQGFEHRAAGIARLVAERLSEVPVAEDRFVERLSMSPIDIAAAATDHEIAGLIAAHIASAIGGRP